MAKTGIGANVITVQKTFGKLFNFTELDLATDGSQFDILFQDGDTFSLGDIEGRVIYTPGHTPACVCYVLGDAVFTGDTIFMVRLRDENIIPRGTLSFSHASFIVPFSPISARRDAIFPGGVARPCMFPCNDCITNFPMTHVCLWVMITNQVDENFCFKLPLERKKITTSN